MTNQTKRYLRQVKRGLPCSRPEKRRCMAELEADVLVYLQKCPDPTIEELCRHFGEPKIVAKAFIAQLSPAQLSRRISVKRKILVGVISIMAILAIFIGVATAIVAYKRVDYYNGYGVDIIDNVTSVVEPAESSIAVH